MKAISYSIFGYGKAREENCDTVSSYLRGLSICLRVNRLLYPDWKNVVNTDTPTYGAYCEYFNALREIGVHVQVNHEAPLCEAMLWRLKPVFEMEGGTWKYTHVLCRDTDSPATYREVQAVEYWISKDKSLHAITDSVSHDRSLMGGMIGIRPAHFSLRMQLGDWRELMSKNPGYDFRNKGTDQDFLNTVIYPRFAQHGSDSITQHYFAGHPNTFLSDYHTCTCPPPAGHREDCPNNLPISLDESLKESNSICGHIGAAGAYEGALFRFLRKRWDKFTDILEAERLHPEIFYWTKEN